MEVPLVMNPAEETEVTEGEWLPVPKPRNTGYSDSDVSEAQAPALGGLGTQFFPLSHHHHHQPRHAVGIFQSHTYPVA